MSHTRKIDSLASRSNLGAPWPICGPLAGYKGAQVEPPSPEQVPGASSRSEKNKGLFVSD